MKKDLIGLIWTDINQRKFSSFLTFLAISLGILSIFLIILISQGFQQSIEKQFEQLGTNRLIIQYDSGGGLMAMNKGLTDNEVKLVKNKPYISSVQPHYIKKVQLKYGNEYVPRLVLSSYIDEDYFEDYDLKIMEGRFPKLNEKYAMVVGPEVIENIFDKKVRVGSNIYIKDMKFKVVGILESIGNPEDDKNIYVNIDSLRKIYDEDKVVHMIYAKVVENYDVKIAAGNIEHLLENKLGDDTIKIMTFDQILESFNSILSIVQMTLGGIAFISLIVGSFGVINIMFIIITEKTKDIGIMKGIGAKNADIFFIYIFQAGIFGLFGGILGMIFGSFGAIGFEVWASSAGFTFLKINISFILVLELLLFSFLLGAISGFIPAYRASKLNVVECFRK